MNRAKAVVFGAGNIGRGFIGQLFSESGYQVVFVDIDENLVENLSRRGEYRLETVFNDAVEAFRIAPVSAVDARDGAAVAKLVADAAIGATAVGAGALKHLAPHLMAGFELRRVLGRPPLNIILCENLKNAATVMSELILACNPPFSDDWLAETIGFVETVVGRMVPAPTADMSRRDPTLIRVEPYKELPVDATRFKGDIPTVSAMVPEPDFARFTARKLYLHNCGHALLAYGGHLLGYEYGWQALADPAIGKLLDTGLAESKAGIVAQYGASRDWLDDHIRDLKMRFSNRSLGDTVFRLARDPVRKLAPNDRLTGALRCAESANIPTPGLCLGIAAALVFRDADDDTSVRLAKRLENEGPGPVLQALTGIAPDEPAGKTILAFVARLRAAGAEALREILATFRQP